MDKDKSIHKTSTGKIFQLTDLEGNPMDYEMCKGIFPRSYFSGLNVGQILRSSGNGMMLKRLK